MHVIVERGHHEHPPALLPGEAARVEGGADAVQRVDAQREAGAGELRLQRLRRLELRRRRVQLDGERRGDAGLAQQGAGAVGIVVGEQEGLGVAAVTLRHDAGGGFGELHQVASASARRSMAWCTARRMRASSKGGRNQKERYCVPRAGLHHQARAAAGDPSGEARRDVGGDLRAAGEQVGDAGRGLRHGARR